MFESILANVSFPTGSGMAWLVYSVLGWVYSWIGIYGLAIIFFTLLLKLVMLPLDFGTKYFQKKNTMRMAEIQPELSQIAQTHAGDPMAMHRARQDVFRKHGYGMTGFCLFTLLHIGIMLFVFISVFQALNGVSSYNQNVQFRELQAVYYEHRTNGTLDTDEFREDIRARYNETRTSFIWVHNIWQPDAMWSRRTLDFDGFRNAASGVQGSVFNAVNPETGERYTVDALRTQYDLIFGQIPEHDQRLNGWLLLVFMAAATTYVSITLNMKIMKKSQADKPKPLEAAPGYSIRDAKLQTANGRNPQMPQMDPAQMGKIMKFMLPVVMILVTLFNTAALALYITISSLISTGIAFGLNKLIDFILKKEKEKTKKKKEEPNMTIINPHAKYFKK